MESLGLCSVVVVLQGHGEVVITESPNGSTRMTLRLKVSCEKNESLCGVWSVGDVQAGAWGHCSCWWLSRGSVCALERS